MSKRTGALQLGLKIERPNHPSISVSITVARRPGRRLQSLFIAPAAGGFQVSASTRAQAAPAVAAAAARPALAHAPAADTAREAMVAEKFARDWLQDRLRAWSAAS